MTHPMEHLNPIEVNNRARESRIKKPKLSLTDYATPTSSVSAFCRAVLLNLIPQKFFGEGPEGSFNRRIIMKHIDSFIKMRRFESLSLHQVCEGLKVCSQHQTVRHQL
jgi:telomerase reverse transcriptase